MRILLQVPDGLKAKALELASGLEKYGNEVIISTEPCYGACDLRDREASALGCDKIVHYGHTKMVHSKVPVDYREMKEAIDPVIVIENNFLGLNGYNVYGLVSSLQFVDSLEKVKEFLALKGKNAIIGRGNQKYPGQILGCDVSAAKEIEDKVDCFLAIGSGRFHSLGFALQTDRPVLAVDVETGNVDNLKKLKEKFMKQKYAAIGMAEQAEKFGILISTKPGQMRLEEAREIKKGLEEKGKIAFLLTMDEIRPEKLMGIDVDCWINTACPRITIENRTEFKSPMISPDELKL